MKTGLIVTGGRLDLAFAGDFLRRYAEKCGRGRDNGRREAEKYSSCEDGFAGEDGGGPCGMSAEKNDGRWGFDCVVIVDGALEYAAALGLRPTAAVGDFDTVRPEVLMRYRQMDGILWDVHKPEKDETDTELAIHTAMELGCTRLAILGATGGRLDHELSNIHLLKMCLDAGVEAALYDAQNKVSLLAEGRIFRRDEAYGTYVSFIPMTEQVKGIWLTGFKYPLCGKNISMGREAGLCVSNELAAETAQIRFDEGILICVESKDEKI